MFSGHLLESPQARFRRSLSTPENFPAGTQKVKILFDIDREAYWDFYVGLMTKPATK